MTWILSAWRLFQMQGWLWVCAALPFSLTFVAAVLLVTGRLEPILPTTLSAAGVSPGLQRPAVLLISLTLVLTSLLANTAMTSMANKAVRGEAIGVRDLFRFRGFGVTSLVLVTTLLATALGSLVFFVGALIAAGLLVGAQSTAMRTGSFRASLRASASVLRADPVRILGLVAFLLLAVTIGVITAGLALLVVLPAAKILGGLADAYGEALSAVEPGTAVVLTPVGGLVPHTVHFHWTADDEAMLRRFAPPPHLPHILAASLVVGLAAFLLYPRSPGVAADLPAPQPAAPPVAPSPVPDASAPAAVPSATAALPESAFTDSYDASADYGDPSLPRRMHWGECTVLIDKHEHPQRLSVMDAAGTTVYTITDDGIDLVRREPLLGGEQPELFVRTSEGHLGIYIALTQQGGVHNIFLLRDAYGVEPLREAGSVAKEIVVDAPVEDDLLMQGRFPVITSTYKWNGSNYENATLSSPEATLARMTQFERSLLAPRRNSDDAVLNEEAIENTASLMMDARVLGVASLPVAVTHSFGYRRGMAWLVGNKKSLDNLFRQADAARQAAAVRQVLPIVAGSTIDDSTP